MRLSQVERGEHHRGQSPELQDRANDLYHAACPGADHVDDRYRGHCPAREDHLPEAWVELSRRGKHLRLGRINGESGGKGGDGGDGGAGGGGPSIAILYTGAVPTVTEADYVIGLPGKGGLSTSLGNAPNGVTGEIVNLDAPSN